MIDVRAVTDPAGLGEVDALYGEVFGGSVNTRLLVALSANSGHVLGAFDGACLVGYGLSFLARDGDRLYQYSQTVAVVPHAQGRGVGRAVKRAQRAAALADGIDLVRWAFDPMHARNAHFNTDVLGVRIRRLQRDFYGEGTDRFVVDWDLRCTPGTVEWDVPVLEPGYATELGDAVAVAIPAEWHAEDAHLRTTTSAHCAEALERGLVGVSCRRRGDVAVYLFAPGSA